MRLDHFRQQVVSTIQSHLPGLATCEVRGGRFSLDEIKRNTFRCPAVFVAILRVPGFEPTGTGEINIQLRAAAYVATQDSRALPRDTAALNIVEALIILMNSQRWGVGKTGAPTMLRAENLYDSATDSRGVSLWALTWDQRLTAGTSIFTDGQLPEDVYVGLSPNVGPPHVEDYERFGIGEEDGNG